MMQGTHIVSAPRDARADASELETKRGRVMDVANAAGAAALVVRRTDTLAWLLCGADVLVSRQGGAVVEAVVHDHGVDVVTNHIEAERLRHEELPHGVDVVAVPWERPSAVGERAAELALERAQGGAVASDAELSLDDARWPLLRVEVERLRNAGRATARIVTDVAATLSPDLSEHAVAGRLMGALREHGLHVPVVLVAGAARLGHVRHPVPTHTPIGTAAMLVVCSEAHGLVSAATRIVRFGDEPGPIAERLGLVLEVEAAMLSATRPGATLGDVFDAARSAYATVGHPDAWRDHHQGGPIAYRPREGLALPGDRRAVAVGAAYAWNPSLPWAKSEDTFVLSDAGLENVTWDERWPSVIVDGRPRADVLSL
jgi:Xaa-Pro aminopeptidase